MDFKLCSRCGQKKSLSAFSRNRKSKDGYNAACSQCKKNHLGTGKPHRPKQDLPEGYKQCSKCGEIKLLNEFSRASSSKDGYRSNCKLCAAEAGGWSYRPKEQLPEGQKRCTTCKQILPATSALFKVDRRQVDGLGTICKACASAYTQQYYREHADEIRAYGRNRHYANRTQELQRMKLRYQANKADYRRKAKHWYETNREYVRKLEQQRYLSNRDDYLKKSRQWRIENRDRYLAYNQKWADENPDKVKATQKAHGARRRARKRNLPYSYTRKDWDYCLKYWGHRCAVCGSNQKLHADHWIPLVNKNCPGTVTDNMICLCGRCNRHKFTKNPYKWLREKLGEEAAKHKFAEIEAYFERVKS